MSAQILPYLCQPNHRSKLLTILSFLTLAASLACGPRPVTSDPSRGFASVNSEPTACAIDYTETIRSPQEFAGLATVAGDIPSHVLFSYFIGVPADQPIGGRMYFQNMLRYERHVMFLQALSPRYASIPDYEALIFHPLDPAAPSKKEINAGAIYLRENIRVGQVTGDYVGVEIYFRTDPKTIGPGQEPGSLINVDDVVATMTKLKEALPLVEADKLVFVLPFKKDLFTYSRALRAKGVNAIVRDAFLGIKTSPTTYNAGKSYGYLRLLSVDDVNLGNYGDEDIIVLPFVPLDVGPTSGIISAQPQVPHSHVVFRAVNQKIPDIYIPGAMELTATTSQKDQLVELVANDDGTYTIRGAAEIPDIEALAKAYWESRKPQIPDLTPNLEPTELLSIDAPVTPETAKAYGAKGTNFAMLHQALAQKGVDRSYFNGSFLIPFSYYGELKKTPLEKGLCKKAAKKCEEELGRACTIATENCNNLVKEPITLQGYLEKLVADENATKMADDSALRQEMLAFTRRLIRALPMPAGIEAMLLDKIKTFPEKQRVRFRSSTNAEDIAGLNGAGLYDSKSVCYLDTVAEGGKDEASACKTPYELQRMRDQIAQLQKLDDPEGKLKPIIADLENELTDKNPLDKGLLGVYASLWTERAYLFRSYYGINHHQIYMGILVQPSMMDEKVNGVVVATLNDDGTMSMDAVSQTEDISITNPIFPNARPEQALVTRLTDGTLGPIRYASSSNMVGECRTVLSGEEIKELADQVFIIGEALIRVYGKERFGNRLDMEFRVGPDGKIVVKQARPI